MRIRMVAVGGNFEDVLVDGEYPTLSEAVEASGIGEYSGRVVGTNITQEGGTRIVRIRVTGPNRTDGRTHNGDAGTASGTSGDRVNGNCCSMEPAR